MPMSVEYGSRLGVVHVSFGLDMGGQEKLLVELAKHVDHRRFDHCFVSLGNRGVLAEDIEACGSQVIALEEPSGLKPGLILRLARLFRRLRPAVVHTHDHRALFYAGPAARLARVPSVIHTCHGLDIRASRRQVLLGVYLSRLVDHYVCVSEDVKAQCQALGVSREVMCTILNGIDISRFAYSGPCANGPVVTVARLNTEKNIRNLVRAAALAASQADDLRVEIAGGGPCLAELKRQAADLGVAGRVTFLGEVRDVPLLLARAGAFVLPSLSEGIPLTILEAMARGLPVVATRVGGIPEVVVDGETGFLVPSDDSAALAGAILRLWRDPDAARRMGLDGRRRVERLFDVRRMVADYEALYLVGRDTTTPTRAGCDQERPSGDEDTIRAGIAAVRP